MYNIRFRPREYMQEIIKLMCSKMKLKKDVILNVNSNQVVVFIKEFVNKKKLLKNVSDNNELDKMYEPAM